MKRFVEDAPFLFSRRLDEKNLSSAPVALKKGRKVQSRPLERIRRFLRPRRRCLTKPCLFFRHSQSDPQSRHGSRWPWNILVLIHYRNMWQTQPTITVALLNWLTVFTHSKYEIYDGCCGSFRHVPQPSSDHDDECPLVLQQLFLRVYFGDLLLWFQ